MAETTMSLIKELRERTGSGMMDCKKALLENNNDMEKAIDWLREKGIASSAKKAGRQATEGVVESYIHAGGRIGVLLEVNIETDFAAKNENFRAFVKDVALQIAAMNPSYVAREDVSDEDLNREREVVTNTARNEGKPEAVIARIVEGRMNKFYEEKCLLEMPFIKDDSKTIGTLLKEMIAFIGENIVIRRFVRFELGEGLEKKVENFAEEVMKQIK